MTAARGVANQRFGRVRAGGTAKPGKSKGFPGFAVQLFSDVSL